MAENFYTILTQIGKGKIANAGVLGTKVSFTQLALGDGNGVQYDPTETQTALVHEVWRGAISSVKIDENNSNWIMLETVIPSTVGNFTIREAGLFDEDGDLLAIGKYPETYKPTAEEGSIKDLLIRMILMVSNTSAITLRVDPSIIIATQKQVDESEAAAKAYADTKVGDLSTLTTAEKGDLVGAVNEMAGAVNEMNSEVLALQTGATPAADANKLGGQEPEYYASADQLAAHEADKVQHIAYATASGTDSYTATITGITALTEGLSVKVKFTNANTGAATLNINGLGAKVIQKSNGSALSSGNIKAGQIVHLVYGGSVFLSLGEGGEYGTAEAAQVLTGYTVGTESGLIAGSMPNRGAASQSLAVNGSYTIPQGYHNGAGQVTQAIPTKGAATITPSTVNQVIAAGQYLSGAQTIVGSANLVAANIKEGVNIFGKIGTLKPLISGIGVAASNNILTVSGLGFTPHFVIGFATQYNAYYGFFAALNSSIVSQNMNYRLWYTSETGPIIKQDANFTPNSNGFSVLSGTGTSIQMVWFVFD